MMPAIRGNLSWVPKFNSQMWHPGFA